MLTNTLRQIRKDSLCLRDDTQPNPEVCQITQPNPEGGGDNDTKINSGGK